MTEEWYGVHVGKNLRAYVNSDAAGNGFFEHRAFIPLIGVDFVARSAKSPCPCSVDL